MVIENLTIPLISPFVDTSNVVLTHINYGIGGLFGLTIIMFIYKIYMFNKFNNKINHITSELADVKKKLNKKQL